MSELTILVDGLAFGEGPRWHEGRLWFSDMHAHVVMSVGVGGDLRTEVEVPHQPSGLGWTPDGRLLVVSMTDRRLLRLDGRQLVEVADLSPYATWHCNDMVVDGCGIAYVGNFGYDMYGGPSAPQPRSCSSGPTGTLGSPRTGWNFRTAWSSPPTATHSSWESPGERA